VAGGEFDKPMTQAAHVPDVSVAQRVDDGDGSASAAAEPIDRAALAELVYRRLLDEVRRERELGSAWS